MCYKNNDIKLYKIIIKNATYYNEHPSETPKIGISDMDKTFAMFVRDPRHGLGYRNLGRYLMRQAKVSPKDVVIAGRFDDLFEFKGMEYMNYVFSELMNGNVLARKWMPRLHSAKRRYAKKFCKHFELSEKDYRALIKCPETVEYKLSHHCDNIIFNTIPKRAINKYKSAIQNNELLKKSFKEYVLDVQKGNKTLIDTNETTLTVDKVYYDIIGYLVDYNSTVK